MHKLNTYPPSHIASALAHIEGRLSTLRIAHLDDLDIRRLLDLVHRLRRDEDELSTDRTSSSLNDQFHAPLAVDTIHEDVAVHFSRGWEQIS